VQPRRAAFWPPLTRAAMNGTMQGHKLFVHIVRATGLEHMNHFTGDHPYCALEVKHLDKSAQATRVETQPVTSGDTLSPIWDEAWEIEPWFQGEALEFTIHDKGLIGSKTEGRVYLPAENIFPNGFSGMLPISGLKSAMLQIEVHVVGTTGLEQHMGTQPPMYSAGAPASGIFNYGAPQVFSPGTAYTYGAHQVPAQTCGVPQSTGAMGQQPLTYAAPPASMVNMPAPNHMVMPQLTAVPQQMAAPMKEQTQPPEKLAVSILQAHGLQHMNHFTGDHPFVKCEVKHNDRSRTTVVETKPVTEGDTNNPFWGETLFLDPWKQGESLEFTVYDKGLLGSKTEGKVVLPSELFHPHGFSGMLLISGLPHALLHVIVRPMGLSKEVTNGINGVHGDLSSKKRRKLSSRKRRKNCC